VTWDQEAISIFELMVVAVEQKAMLVEGGIANQPTWFISLLAWFGPAYEGLKFMSRVRMVVGDGDAAGAVSKQSAAFGKNGKRT